MFIQQNILPMFQLFPLDASMTLSIYKRTLYIYCHIRSYASCHLVETFAEESLGNVICRSFDGLKSFSSVCFKFILK